MITGSLVAVVTPMHEGGALDLERFKQLSGTPQGGVISPLLSKRFVDAQFEFRSKFLQGQPQQRERWKRGACGEDGFGATGARGPTRSC